MSALLGPQILDGNKTEVLLNGDQIFPAMLSEIRQARRTITFETYIYWSESIGREFADALIERARAGVKVHVLLDWVGSSKMEERYLDGMSASRRAGDALSRAALVAPGAFQQPHASQGARRRRRGRVHRRRRHRGQMARATRRTPSIGATRTSGSKARWWRRCRRSSWTTGSRRPARCCTARRTFPRCRRAASMPRRCSAARPPAAAKACT